MRGWRSESRVDTEAMTVLTPTWNQNGKLTWQVQGSGGTNSVSDFTFSSPPGPFPLTSLWAGRSCLSVRPYHLVRRAAESSVCHVQGVQVQNIFWSEERKEERYVNNYIRTFFSSKILKWWSGGIKWHFYEQSCAGFLRLSAHSCCFSRILCCDAGGFPLGTGDLLASQHSNLAVNRWGVLTQTQKALYVL